jgi:hypothetical protein
MTEPTYSPTKILTAYWTGHQWVISISDSSTSEKPKPFIVTDLRLATAAIEAKLMEIREEEK